MKEQLVFKHSAVSLCYGGVQDRAVQKFQTKVNVYKIIFSQLNLWKDPNDHATTFFYLSITIKPMLFPVLSLVDIDRIIPYQFLAGTGAAERVPLTLQIV